MSTTFITGQTLGSLRNDVTGRVGFKFTTISRIRIISLGRWVVSGNSAIHTLHIYVGGVSVASVSVNCSGATPGEYLYANLGTPLFLGPGVEAFCESEEVSGGDQFYNANTTITPMGVASVAGGSANEVTYTGANTTYGPVNFNYEIPLWDWTIEEDYSAKNSSAVRKPDQSPRRNLRGINWGDQLVVFGGRNNSEGDLSQPSLEMLSRGVWRFRWAFLAGARTISVRVKQEVNLSPRPTLVVKANPEIGIAADVIETAPSGSNWVTIGPAAITPSANGATWVELHANYDGLYRGAPCYWDKIETT